MKKRSWTRSKRIVCVSSEYIAWLKRQTHKENRRLEREFINSENWDDEVVSESEIGAYDIS